MNQSFEIIPLTIEARGEVITNNVAEFRELVQAALLAINRSPSTDEEFAEADSNAKALKGAEQRIEDAKDKALSDAKDLYQLLKDLDATSEEIRQARLELEKAVNKRKDELKAEIIQKHLDAFDIDPRDALRHFLKPLQDAIKGKRTLDSMDAACAAYQEKRQGEIHDSRAMIDSFSKAHGDMMLLDRRELELKTPDLVEIELKRRFESQKAAEEKLRLQREADEAKAALKAAETPQAAPVAGSPADKLNPHNLPPPPKVGAIAVGPTPAAEWESFKQVVFAAFASIKEAKARLRHDENIQRAIVFGEGVNAAWKSTAKQPTP